MTISRILIAIVLFIALPVLAQPAGKLSGTPAEKAAQKAKVEQLRLEKACEEHAMRVQNAKKAHPGRVTPYPVAYKKCMELRSAK